MQPGRSGGLGSIAGGTGTGAGNSAGTRRRCRGREATHPSARRARRFRSPTLRASSQSFARSFKNCYQTQGLNIDPGMSGSVTMVVKIAPNGEVNSVDPGGNTGLSDPVVRCITRVLKNAQFDAPGSSGWTVPTSQLSSSSSSQLVLSRRAASSRARTRRSRFVPPIPLPPGLGCPFASSPAEHLRATQHRREQSEPESRAQFAPSRALRREPEPEKKAQITGDSARAVGIVDTASRDR